MARRIIIENILNLIKGLGGNPNKFMGTKTNINFLGKGPRESLFQGQIDVDGMVRSGFPLERIITEAESAGGYATAGKLNDLQLQRLETNLSQLKKAYFPEQVPNITDLKTGIRNLDQEGIASLRGGRTFADEVRGGRTFADELAGAEGVTAEETILPTGRMMGKGDPRRELTGESGVPGDIFNDFARVRNTFNPKNEVHVEKARALLEDPQLKGVYTEAEVKNAFDFEGLYQSHFDKGHVDVAMLLEQGGHNIPQMRASARDALLSLMKKEDLAGDGLRHFVKEPHFKYITEGGGGRAGDPINLFVTYFGKNAAESLPKNPTKENIDKFTDFIMRAKDSRGRGINDPFFDRETIDFSLFKGFSDDLPFKTGGRVAFKWGSGLSKALLRRINKKVIKDAVDDIFPTGDYKMDAEMAAEALVENNPKLFGGKLLDDLNDHARSDVYGLVLDEVTTRFGLQVRKNRGIKSLLTDVNEQFGEGTLKRASELPKGTKYAELEAIKDFEARNRTFSPNREKIRAHYQGKIDDELLDQILIDDNPQRIAEVLATIDEALLMQGRGMGSQDIMAALRASWGRKPSASGGLARILEV